MTYETKKQQRERFIAEFLRRLRDASAGTRVYMPVGDVFKDADIVSIDEHRATRRTPATAGRETSRESDLIEIGRPSVIRYPTWLSQSRANVTRVMSYKFNGLIEIRPLKTCDEFAPEGGKSTMGHEPISWLVKRHR